MRNVKNVILTMLIVIVLLPFGTFAQTTAEQNTIQDNVYEGSGGGGGSPVPTPVPIQPPTQVNIKVTINGKEILSDLPYYEKDNTYLGSIRSIAEALGVQANWDTTTQQITFLSADTTLVVTIGSNQATLNGQQINMPIAPTVVSGRTIVPIQFVVECFGGTVEFSARAIAPTVDKVTNQSIVITGSGIAGLELLVKKEETVIAEGVINSDGTFSIPISAQLAGTRLTIIARDEQGNLSLPVNVTVSDVDPPTPVNTKVIINGQEVTFDALYEKNGTFLGAVRAIGEALGIEMSWNPDTREITFSSPKTNVVLTIGSYRAMVNGEEVMMEIAPTVVSGRTIVPIRFVVECFGGSISIKRNLEFDQNADGIVDLFDIVISTKNFPQPLTEIAKHYGKSVN